MSMVSFVGYVNALVVEKGILQELPNAILTQKLVSYEDEEIIDKIAGEKEAHAKKRKQHEWDLQTLNGVLKTLREYV